MFNLLLQIQLAFGSIGLVWMILKHYPFIQVLNPTRDVAAFLVLISAHFAVEKLSERFLSNSYQAYEAQFVGQMVRAFANQKIGYQQALALAIASGIGEELFFRGALQNALGGGLLGIVGQGLIFGALHPINDRKAWVYPLMVLVLGLFFGASYFFTHSLFPGILAHFLINARAFYQIIDMGRAAED